MLKWSFRDFIRALERHLRRAKRHHAQYRPENFLRRQEMRVCDNPVATRVKHFQFNANLRKLFRELGQIFLTETVLALSQNSRQWKNTTGAIHFGVAAFARKPLN